MKPHGQGWHAAAAAIALAVASNPVHGDPAAPERVRLPGTDYDIVVDPPAGVHESTPPAPVLVKAIGTWLSHVLELPPAPEPPRFQFVKPEVMLALRYRGIPSDHSAGVADAANILAVYDDSSRTIYLRDDWHGDTAADLSIVVHEFVHHLQNLAGLRFECNEAREKQAFAAQQQWLALFGKDLGTEFSLDPFTLLVRTSCAM